MEKPKGLGSWPVIIPGENVEVYYEKERVTGPTVVEDANVLDIVTPSMPAKSTFEIEVSPDKMEVILVVTFKTGKIYAVEDHSFTRKLTVKAKVVTETPPKPIDPAGVFEELQRLGIEVPVYHDVVQQACSELKSGKFVIARGVPPVQPEDGRVNGSAILLPNRFFPVTMNVWTSERECGSQQLNLEMFSPNGIHQSLENLGETSTAKRSFPAGLKME